MSTTKIKYLLKIGELALKGGNRKFFEKTLRSNIRKALKGIPCSVSGGYGRFFLDIDSEHSAQAETILARCFGLIGYARCYCVSKDLDDIKNTLLRLAESHVREYGNSFKIETRRTDKGFALSSYQLSCAAGDWIREALPQTRVQLQAPDWAIHIEVREEVYLYGMVRPGPGGLPAGVAGRGLLLLSGGIDSPVAGYMMAKRGLELEGLYFHAYPYTSDQALEKVKTLAGKLALYNNGFSLHVANFTEVQLALKSRASESELTLHMRAAMMSLASRLAASRNALALVSGEALSQVASQTIMSLRYTNSFTQLPVFRPVIGMDKEEIIRIARTIDTFDTSILPYEDCCTLFSPKNPKTRPDFESTVANYARLKLEESLEECFAGIQCYRL